MGDVVPVGGEADAETQVGGLPDVGSTSAWRARIHARGPGGSPVEVPSEYLQRSFAGVREVFRHCLVASLGALESGQEVGGNDLAVGYSALEHGNYALWFDIRDRRHRFTRWLTPKETWNAAVESLLGEASAELIALLRATAMAADGHGEGLMIRPDPGPEGMRSRMEVSLPGYPAARLSADLWDWSQGAEGIAAVRDMFAVVLAPEVQHIDVVLYAGDPQEERVRLEPTGDFVAFLEGAPRR